jgi:lysophospholipase
MDPAPFFADVATAALSLDCYRIATADGVGIRVGVQPKGDLGTALICPGRTEYVEKYVHIAEALAAAGYASVTIDWRGQGLADRLLDDPRVGHVVRFPDYQHDLRAAAQAAADLGLPSPLVMLAHSMGGCIGLRGLMDGRIGFAAAVFTGPMWGIRIAPALRPLAWGVGLAAQARARATGYAPTTGPMSYVETAPFAGNTLTRDPDMFAAMQRQVRTHPALALGGPSVNWLIEGLKETRALSLRPAPAVACMTALGTAEKVVEVSRIRARMADWPGGRLDLYPEAEHEIMMEKPHHRERFMADAVALFEGARATA